MADFILLKKPFYIKTPMHLKLKELVCKTYIIL